MHLVFAFNFQTIQNNNLAALFDTDFPTAIHQTSALYISDELFIALFGSGCLFYFTAGSVVKSGGRQLA